MIDMVRDANIIKYWLVSLYL